MNKFTPTLLIALSLSAVPAQATATRTWVSGKGSDTNPCTLASPCRTFAYAISQTTPGGEIDVLDPAGYGALTITQSISIVNDGVGTTGVQAAAGATAITINAGSTDVVYLRGLTVEGAGIAQYGIQFNSGASLAVEKCFIRHFTKDGIWLNTSASSKFTVSDSIASDNGGNGISIMPLGGSLSSTISGVMTNHNTDGVHMDIYYSPATAVTTIVNSIAANNSGTGFYVRANPSYIGAMILRNVTATGNSAGFWNTGYYRTVLLSRALFSGNLYGTLNRSYDSFMDNFIGANNAPEPPGGNTYWGLR